MVQLEARVHWIDVLRGIAILLMIPANLSFLWGESHPLWFRLGASYAAPIFIMLSTGMLVLNTSKNTLSYALERGALIIGFGVFMDICVWRTFPFVSFDVLYIIGIALPIIYLAYRFSEKGLIITSIIIFLLTPILQFYIGYHTSVLDIDWDNKYWPGITRLLQSWFIDGWFPVFPWLGFAVLGAVFFRTVFACSNHCIPKRIVVFSSFFLIAGFLLLFCQADAFKNLSNGGILTERAGYAEIFYPPTLPYIMTALGMVVILSKVAQYITRYRLSSIISLFGRFSLLAYFLHQAIAVYIILPIVETQGENKITSGLMFFICVTSTIIFILFICFFVEHFKRRKKIIGASFDK